jgi:hypothetical protein
VSRPTLVVATALLTLAIGAITAYRPAMHSTTPPTQPHGRLASLRIAEATLGVEAVSLEQRSASRSKRLAEGMSDEELRGIIRAQLTSNEPTEDEMRRWYEANRRVFGLRTFEQSRFAVDRLLRIERTRAHLIELGVKL